MKKGASRRDVMNPIVVEPPVEPSFVMIGRTGSGIADRVPRPHSPSTIAAPFARGTSAIELGDRRSMAAPAPDDDDGASAARPAVDRRPWAQLSELERRLPDPRERDLVAGAVAAEIGDLEARLAALPPAPAPKRRARCGCVAS